MIRKGLRPRIKPALDRSRDSSAFRRVFPFRRSWFAISILAAFDIVFLIPAINTFQEAATEWGKFDNLFDLVAALFLSAWLLGWSIAPLLMTAVLALMLFGREVIKVRPGTLVVFLGLPFVGVAAEYEVARMRNLRIEHPPKKSGKSWRGPHLVFDYGANKVAVGTDIGESGLADITSRIQMASGKKMRRGEATPGELSGKWTPSIISEQDPAPDTLAIESVAAREPVTMGSPSTLALITANLVPIAGAAFYGWNLGDVMVLYWAESAVVGFFNVCKIVVIGRWLALLAGPFFLGHFGGFMAIHFLFIYGLFIQGLQDTSGGDLGEVVQLFISLWPALAALFVSHAFSFHQNFMGRREYRGRTVQNQMSEPYSRIIFMHLVLIFGGGLTLVLGEPTPVLLIVIALKIWLDIRAHLKQRSKR
jgi:hypothetical protein